MKYRNRQYQFLLNTIKPFKWLLSIQLLIMAFWAFNVNFKPYLIKLIIDTFQNNTLSSSAKLYPVLGYIVLSVTITLLHSIYDYLWITINPSIKTLLTASLTNHMLHHSENIFKSNLSGSLANKIQDVAQNVPKLIKLFINNIYSYCFAFIFAAINLYLVHPIYSFMMLLWVTFFLLGVFYFSKQTQVISINSSEAYSSIIGQIVDLFTNITNIKSFCSTAFELRKIKQKLHTHKTIEQKRDRLMLKSYLFQELSFFLYQILCITIMFYQLRYHQITVGDFIMIISLNISLSDCLWDIPLDLTTTATYLGTILQGLTIALEPPHIKNKHKASPLIVSKGEIVFKSVYFHYNDKKPLFRNQSLKIKPQEKIGLVGLSGSGKSTFIKLITRSYDPQKGAIFIDGQNIKEVTLTSLHNAISLIPQNPSLFHRSIIENIRYGKPHAKKSEIIEAAKKAHIHEFIMGLKNKYHTIIGQETNLSGGQQQRICIARAFLKNAPILILDEATSQVDALAEKEIQSSLAKLMVGKTTLTIAHKLQTMINMDRILVFEKGGIVQDGNHLELINTDGLYKKLCENQPYQNILDTSSKLTNTPLIS